VPQNKEYTRCLAMGLNELGVSLYKETSFLIEKKRALRSSLQHLMY
jgi:hypothetical protein